MREAERREQAAVEYARAVEQKRQIDQRKISTKLILPTLKNLKTM